MTPAGAISRPDTVAPAATEPAGVTVGALAPGLLAALVPVGMAQAEARATGKQTAASRRETRMGHLGGETISGF
ncbi:hypothetical protein D3C72_1960060 [compost metagenome]